jgi:hypothetical protein
MNFDPFWTAVAAIVAVLGLAVVLLTHIVRYAYAQGAFNQRLLTVESQLKESVGIKEVVAGLSATVEGLTRAVDRLDRATERLGGVQPSTAPSGRRTRPVAVGD